MRSAAVLRQPELFLDALLRVKEIQPIPAAIRRAAVHAAERAAEHRRVELCQAAFRLRRYAQTLAGRAGEREKTRQRADDEPEPSAEGLLRSREARTKRAAKELGGQIDRVFRKTRCKRRISCNWTAVRGFI